MNLKRLEMYGFKSFADKTIIEFKDGITGVVGPNGSGKSNISDCIRWILGEQSLKALRGTKTEDIIFSGTQNRRPLGFAEASLVFDNLDGKLPIEYTEVTITRRLYRSGESGYFINKAPCRLKDVQELFMDTGIGKDGYSIIGQGKVDEILSNKSEDRRHIFEEAAGIVKYRTRKNESEKKLEQTKLNLLRINDIISEIETNIDSLKTQSEKAKKFLSLRDELKNIEISLFLYNIDDYKSKIEEIKKDLGVIETQKTDEEEKQVKLQEQRDDLKKNLEELLELIEKTQNLGFELEKKKEQINSQITVNEERISNNEENYKRFEIEIEELKEKNKTLEEDKEKKLNKKTDLSINKEKFEQELEKKTKEYEEFSKTLSSKALEIEEKKNKVDKNVDRKYELIAISNTEIANYENLVKRGKALDQELGQTIRELDSTRAQKSEVDSSFFGIQSKRNGLQKELDEIKEKNSEKSKILEDYNSKINAFENEYRIKESRLKFLVETEKEKEGYNKSVKEVLTLAEKNPKFSKGMNGVLAGLLTVPKEYETAIEMALGNSIQNIVTDTEEEAKQFVEYLRKNKLGRCSFFPISSMKGQKLSKVNSTGIDGVFGIASDLIKYNQKYEQIVLNLLGKTVIVEDMDSAIALSRKNSNSFRIVTLKGDIINSSGSITGGYVAPKTVNLLGRGSEIKALEKELKQIKEKIEKVKNEKAEYESKMSEVLSKLESKQIEFNELQITFATEEQKIKNFELEVLKLEAKKDKLKEDIENNKTEQSNSKTLQEEHSKEMTDLENENNELNSQIEEFSKQHQDDQKYIDDLKFDINNLQISVSSFDESGESIDEFVNKLNEDIEENNKSIENKTKLREEILIQNEELRKSNVDLKAEIEKQELDAQNSSGKVQELKDERTLKNNKLSDIEAEIIEKQNIIEDLKNQISKQDVKISKFELELEQVINKMWEEYELTPNNVKDIEKTTSPTKVQKQVNELRNQMKDLGSVNIDSIKEYQEVKERYDFLITQKEDLENTISKLKKLINEIVDTMKDQFNEKFSEINRNFKDTFRELFGGGKAELKLEDSSNVLECGIEIEVEPPGKKLQSMSLLSGGERAFTAIALLFAILKINPAPFCVLDEIEAALDDVNVSRFAEYLKRFDDNTQFLVITHRKGTMEAADTMYGITMEEKGISKLLSMNMKQ